jgi:hypothetical protein
VSGVPSKIPVQELLEATDAVADKKLRTLLFKLATKIDGGFTAMHTFVVAARQQNEDLKVHVGQLGTELEALKRDYELDCKNLLERIAKLEAKRKRGDGSTQVALARHEGALEAREKDAQQKLEWAKLSVPVRVALITAGIAALSTITGAVIHALVGS